MSRFYGKRPAVEPVVVVPLPAAVEPPVVVTLPEVIEDVEPEEIEPFVEWQENSENDS